MIVSDAQIAVASAEITSSPSIDSDNDGVADTYGVGENIDVTVTFTETVSWNVSGAGKDIQVTLGVGSNDRAAPLMKGGQQFDDEATLVFRYTVVAADVDADGITVKQDGNNIIKLVGGATLRHASKTVSLRHAALAADTGHKTNGAKQPDTAAPYPTAVTVTGKFVNVRFSEALNPGSVPAASAFTVTVGGTSASITDLDLGTPTSKDITLTLASAPTASQTVTVRYTKPTMNPLRDGGGNEADSFGPISRPTDYDTDNDTLIEISTAAQLNAIRWDGTATARWTTASTPPARWAT